MSAPDVWVAKDDGSDLIRAEAIAGVGRDYSGAVTARLAGSEAAAVTLVMPGPQDGPDTPEDFHRQLIKVIAELSDTADAVVVRPICVEPHGWRWVGERL
jgi:hypothetical protein